MPGKADEEKIMARVAEEHRRDPHPGMAGPRLRLHLAVHTVVEAQLLDGNPAETGATLERLQAQGLGRHEAVHLIGTVVSEELFEVMQDGRAYDEARYVGRLRALEAKDWITPPDPAKKSD